MLCEHCGANMATIYLKNTLNGETAELRLCTDCAGRLGYTGGLADMGFDVGSFLSGMMGLPTAASAKKFARSDMVCPDCGASFRDLERTGKLGCAECYGVFREQLMPSIQRIHGNVQYEGHIPDGASEGLKRERAMRGLQDELRRAIEAQEFEQAAALRDKIRALAGEGGETHE